VPKVPAVRRVLKVAGNRNVPRTARGTPGTLGTLGTLSSLVALRPPLENLYRTFDHVNAASDPVHIVRRYQAAEDQEVVAFCAAGLAFGRVASVLHSIESLLAVMGPSPAAFVRTFDPAVERRRLAPLVHRWIGGKDLAALLMILRRMLEEADSIEQFFMAGDDPASPDVAPALEAFSARALATDLRPIYRSMPKRAGVRYFFPRPSAGSACKRLNLFLRWMVRRDAIDLGVWSGLSSARLIVPLDTHVIRLGQCLRLTRYRTPGWKMAADITAALRRVNPDDPVRYDFSLCHVGMMNACRFGRAKQHDHCPLRGFCNPGTGSARMADRRGVRL
jgi:uncharacterized protein (TIGR02757 family)